MQDVVKLFDMVALVVDLPEYNLRRGQVGTVVEYLAPNIFEVEFNDQEGQVYESLALSTDKFVLLRRKPAKETNGKILVKLLVDAEVVAYFKKQAHGQDYQGVMNEALKTYSVS